MWSKRRRLRMRENENLGMKKFSFIEMGRYSKNEG